MGGRRQGKKGILDCHRNKGPEERKCRAGVEKGQEMAFTEVPRDGVHEESMQGSHISLDSPVASERKKKKKLLIYITEKARLLASGMAGFRC